MPKGFALIESKPLAASSAHWPDPTCLPKFFVAKARRSCWSASSVLRGVLVVARIRAIAVVMLLLLGELIIDD